MTSHNEERSHATNQYKTPAQKESDFLSNYAGVGVE